MYIPIDTCYCNCILLFWVSFFIPRTKLLLFFHICKYHQFSFLFLTVLFLISSLFLLTYFPLLFRRYLRYIYDKIPLPLHPTLYTRKNRSTLAYMKKKHYLCTAFSVREAGESPAQSRCCDSQSDVQILISHWFLSNWEG